MAYQYHMIIPTKLAIIIIPSNININSNVSQRENILFLNMNS